MASDRLVEKTKKILEETGVIESDQKELITAAKLLFSDSAEIWPLHYSAFYLGQVPSLNQFLMPMSVNEQLVREKLLYNMISEWHVVSV